MKQAKVAIVVEKIQILALKRASSQFPRAYKSQQLESNTIVESKTMPPVCCNVKAYLCFCVSDVSGF